MYILSRGASTPRVRLRWATGSSRGVRRGRRPAGHDGQVIGYHQFDDAYRARWTVVRLFYEGWHRSSIAGLLGLSRQHVWNILQAFERDGFAGLEDGRARPMARPSNSRCPS